MGPKRDLATAHAKYEVIHNQRRLFRPIDVQSSLSACNHDLYLRPFPALHIRIGFIDARVLLS